jgi:hypothetical protein
VRSAGGEEWEKNDGDDDEDEDDEEEFGFALAALIGFAARFALCTIPLTGALALAKFPAPFERGKPL